MKMLRWSVFVLLLALRATTFGKADSYRITWRDDPATTVVIAWNQVSGEDPEVCYGLVDHGTDARAYAHRAMPARVLQYRGMNNHFARLENLEPDTAYYFALCDSEGVGRRLWFKTAPARPTPFTFVSGGDSRSNPGPRREGNRLVAALRPLFVLFGGDYSGSGTAEQWQQWFADWQLSISDDGRIYPIIATHGNHENADLQMMEHLFDTPHPDQYYSVGVGGDLLRIWVLNSELEFKAPKKVEEQNRWIREDLARHPHVRWKLATYHRPMRAHTAHKGEGLNRITWWAQLFYEQGIDAVIESDTHMVKQSYPVRPSEEEGSYESFVRDDANGYVFIGEGSWGAPKRPANDDKPWTMASDSFHQFKWIQVFPEEMLVRTVKFENVDGVEPLGEKNRFDEPVGMVFWEPESGKVLRLPFDPRHASYTTPAPPRTIVANGAEWEWGLDGENWGKATAPLGYGDSKVNALPLEAGAAPLSVAFRKSFEIEKAEQVSRLFFDIKVDDGCVITLNGKQVATYNMPKGTLTRESLARERMVGWRFKQGVSLPVDPKYLQSGTNVIQVRVHQHSPESSDLMFDMAVRVKE